MLQTIGVLSGPIVTAVYLLEQIEVFIFGSTTRCSDSRILINFVIHVVLVFACLFISKSPTSNKAIPTLLACIVSGYLTSRNTLFSFCTKKPFKVVNEQLTEQKILVDIVFAPVSMTVIQNANEN